MMTLNNAYSALVVKKNQETYDLVPCRFVPKAFKLEPIGKRIWLESIGFGFVAWLIVYWALT